MTRYAGKNARILMAASGGTTGIATVLAQSAWSLNMESDKIDVTAFEDGNKQYVLGFRDVSGSFSGFWDEAETKPFTASVDAAGTFIYLYPDVISQPTFYWYGPAWVDASVEASVDGAIQVSCNFVARGTWYRSPA